MPWSLAAAGLLLALCLGVIVVRDRRTIDTDVYHSSILLPGRLGAPVIGTPAALSPDGRHLAFVAAETGGRDQLWLRPLDSAVARPVPETEGARTPFWSPDGRWLAFVTPRGALKKVSASGGPAVTICESVLAGGAWSRDDVILFTESTSRSLARVRAAGGTPSAVTTIDVDAGEAAHLSPTFLPDGRRFVYAVVPNLGPANLGLSLGSLDSGARDRLPVEARFAQHAQGFLWFMRGNTLMAQPFEPGGARLVGEAVPVAEQVRTGANGSVVSVSAAGALVFQTDVSPRGSELTWFDRTGRPTATLGTVDDYSDPQLSPDGRRAVVSVGESGTNNRDLWVFDLARGVRTRLTSSPEPEMHSAWSPDGALIAFDAGRAGRFGMFQRRADGTGEVEALLTGDFDANPVAWSPDGRSILYVKRQAGTVNLWVLPLDGERKPFAFTRSKGNIPAQFSPDGRWVVFASSDSGRMEIYVAPFPGPGPRSLVSTGGGLDPRWVRDGREILYLDIPNGKLMSAAVTMRRDRVDIGDVKPLFDLPKVGTRGVFDVSADGQRILAMTRKDDSSSAPLTLVVNWPALLKK